MKGFAGFPAGKQPYTPVPELFFAELLPEVDHLGELKVTLHVFWLLAQQKGERPYIAGDELAADGRLLAGLAGTGRPPEEVLADALERAVARGTLLRAFTPQREWYFVNSERGRRAVEEMLAGQWSPAPPGEAVEVQVQRPNIFALYEQNIGPLTPLLAEELKEAETSYPASWIEDAFREAV
ncbi:MAG TPA: primosomal replication protein N, partial [Anaerolineae bacterium]|nr:primosomal replication protein N [Anaerolineae bacterium]